VGVFSCVDDDTGEAVVGSDAFVSGRRYREDTVVAPGSE
jgi:hypothetical protein